MANAVTVKQVNAYMDKDHVRPAQLKSYLPLMGRVEKVLGDIKPSNAHGVAAGLPVETRKALGALMVGLPKSHRWVKGLIAVYVAVQANK